MAKHAWKLDAYGEIDIFAYNEGYHNGPECVVCGVSFCEHCHPEFYYEECTGNTETVKRECEWCNGKETKLAEGEYTGLYMEGNTITAYGEGEAVIKINYCPNCGRILI